MLRQGLEDETALKADYSVFFNGLPKVSTSNAKPDSLAFPTL